MLGKGISMNDRINVLVAEDDFISRTYVFMYLELSGYHVDQEDNGFKAIELYKTFRNYGIIITDINMPGLDGLEVMKIIRDIEHANYLKPTYIAVMTSLSSCDIKRQDSSLYANKILQKPVSTNEIDLMLREASVFLER